jgi:hypothetical protein
MSLAGAGFAVARGAAAALAAGFLLGATINSSSLPLLEEQATAFAGVRRGAGGAFFADSFEGFAGDFF